MAKPPVRDNAPVVQRMRLRYRKQGPLKFSSHRDFQRAFERAVRRVGVPIGYSSGFSPHPKISYANAAPTGTASEAEYVEIGLTEPVAPAALLAALAGAMPAGLAIVDAVVARTADFVERLQAGVWQLEVGDWTGADTARAVELYKSAAEVVVTRKTKNGPRTFDTRSAVLDLAYLGDKAAESGTSYAILRLVIRQLTPAVRPDDVLSGICQVAGLQPPLAARITRLAQGPLTADGLDVGDPLDADRIGTDG